MGIEPNKNKYLKIQPIVVLSVAFVISGSLVLVSFSHLGVMGDNVTQSVLFISSLLRNFVLVTVIIEMETFFITKSCDIDKRFAPDFRNKTSFRL